ncbi:MAG: response regulator [Patescibacteria group bacterium]
MEKIKVLITEDNPKMAYLIEKLLGKTFYNPNQEMRIVCEFTRTSSVSDTRIRIEHEEFDLIYLDGTLKNNMSTLPLIPKIYKNNLGATVFILSANPNFLIKATNCFDPTMCFMKHVENFEQIISAKDLETIRLKIVEKNS